MKLLRAKTTRFAVVVERCGTPEVYTLWQKPENDRHFQSLIKNHRIMTVQQSPTGTDFGLVDFFERKGVTYLAFPKSLKRFEENRIVGIRWDLIPR